MYLSLGNRKYKLFDVTTFIFSFFPTFRLMHSHYQRLNFKCWLFILNLATIKWNLIKPHAKKLNSSIYNTHIIKQYKNKWATTRSILRRMIWWDAVNQLSKICKDKDCLLLYKVGWSLLIKKLSIKVTIKSFLVIARMNDSSKLGKRL